jgi:hypothetical protein
MPDSLERRYRRTDPRESVEAARRAIGASLRVLHALERLLSDGRPRIDEEMFFELRTGGLPNSADAVRHARLTLAEALPPLIRRTGVSRPTQMGQLSREWVIIGAAQARHAMEVM